MDLAVEAPGKGGGPTAPVRDLAGYRAATRARGEFTAYVGMLVFLASWAMLFAGLFAAYGFVRLRAPSWPPPGDAPLPLALPAANTVLILLSSAAVQLGLHELRGGRAGRAARALAGAAALGLAFLALQAVVWAGVYRAGLVPSGGPYPSAFYALTCFHALHVLVGLGAMIWLAGRAFAGAYGSMRHVAVRLWAMYWHFVGGVWVVLFATVYVL